MKQWKLLGLVLVFSVAAGAFAEGGASSSGGGGTVAKGNPIPMTCDVRVQNEWGADVAAVPDYKLSTTTVVGGTPQFHSVPLGEYTVSLDIAGGTAQDDLSTSWGLWQGKRLLVSGMQSATKDRNGKVSFWMFTTLENSYRVYLRCHD